MIEYDYILMDYSDEKKTSTLCYTVLSIAQMVSRMFGYFGLRSLSCCSDDLRCVLMDVCWLRCLCLGLFALIVRIVEGVRVNLK